MYGLKVQSASPGGTRALARYLVTRGLLLVLLELTVIRASWTFGLDYSQFILAGVIWMLGWCMVLLAALVWLPTRAVGIIGLLIIVFQNAFEPLGRMLAGIVALAVGVRLSRWGRGHHRSARTVGLGALHDRPVDRRDGGRLCVWRDHGARARRTSTGSA